MAKRRAATGHPRAAADGTRDALLEAAAKRFGRYGPRKTTMEEVARSAGLSRATVYKHFPNKDALYRALLDRITDEFVAEVEACIGEGGGPRETLRRIVEIAHRVYSRSPVLLGAVAEDDEMRIEAIATEAMRRHEARVISLLAKVLDAGVRAESIRPIDPKAVAYLMFQLGHVLVIRELSGRRGFPLKKILDAMDDLINFGLARPRTRA